MIYRSLIIRSYRTQTYYALALLGAIVSLALAPGAANAADSIRLRDGKALSGAVTDVSSTEVSIEQGAAKVAKRVPANTIESIAYDNEPKGLTAARVDVRNGAYDAALKALAKIPAGDLTRKEIKQDADFYKAFAGGQLALAGAGAAQARQDAGKDLVEFEQANPTSFHYYAACELIGDLLVSLENYKNADEYYEKIFKAPWPEYQMKAGVSRGRMLAAQNKHAEAIQKFDEVINFGGETKDAIKEQLSAQLGKAYSLAATKQLDEAIALVESVIQKADPTDHELHARAYNVEGNCYLAAGKQKEAHIAFLHVDVLYSAYPAEHAEALGHLAKLWQEVYHREQYAKKAEADLKARYPNSRWAKDK